MKLKLWLVRLGLMRRVLRFKPEMLDLVLKGVKTSTVRPWNNTVYSDELVLTDGRRKVPAKLVKVEKLKLSEAASSYLSEGFKTPDEFLRSITHLYPTLSLDGEVTLIRFKPDKHDGRP
ncbi:MAG: ASCH domain-containing protein [Candidatus Caldarchaeum sp.]